MPRATRPSLRMWNCHFVPLVMLLALGIAPASLAAETDETKMPLEQRLLPLLEAHQGEVSLAVKHLTSGETYEYQAERPMPTASLIKVPVMIAA